MNAMIETSRPFGTDGTTYGFERPMSAEQRDAHSSRYWETVTAGMPRVPAFAEPIVRPAVAELAAAGAGPSARRVTSRAHKADLTEAQLKGLKRAANGVINGTRGRTDVGAGVSITSYRALAAKGYGRCVTAGELGYQNIARFTIVQFEINDLGRRALAEHEAAS